ncbi:MAG: hypothetical protein AB7P40_02410 [Chloroflexota bacterium]
MDEYKVIQAETDALERELNALAKEGWQPVLVAPQSFGGASWTNVGPGRVDRFCVILRRA